MKNNNNIIHLLIDITIYIKKFNINKRFLFKLINNLYIY